MTEMPERFEWISAALRHMDDRAAARFIVEQLGPDEAGRFADYLAEALEAQAD